MASWTPPPFGSPVWIEIPAVDVVALKEFYTKVFPAWTFKPADEKFKEEDLARFNLPGDSASALSGGIVKKEKVIQQGKESGVVIYLLVDSIDKTAKIVQSLGGELLTAKEKEGESGWHMHIRDLAGNKIGIYEFGASS